MRKYQATALFVIIGFLFTIPASSQSTSGKDTIRSVTNFWGTKYYLGQERKDMKQVTELLSTNQEAGTYWKKGKTQSTIATIMVVIAGGMIGWELGQATNGKKMNGTVLAIAGGLYVPAIIIEINGIKNKKKAL